MGALSDYAEALALDTIFGTASDRWVQLHEANLVDTQSASGQADLVVEDDVAVGAVVRTKQGENYTVDSKSGAGPYTLTLDRNLVNTQEVGDPIGVRTEDGSTMGTAIQARTAMQFSAAVQGDPTLKSNSTEADFGDPASDTWITSYTVYDASSGGNLLGSGNLVNFLQVQAAVTEAVKFAVGEFDIDLD